MEFFERQDAYNVFDYLWPNDLLALSSTCISLRATVNSYCSNLKQVKSLPSSSTCNDDKHPAICRYLRWWLRRCLQCKNEMEISKCVDLTSPRLFIPEVLKGYVMIPICSQNCSRMWPYLKKITKTDAMKRFSLNDKEVSVVRHMEQPNPHYSRGPSMKLFYETEVELAAMKKFNVTTRDELSSLLNKRREKQASRTEKMRITKGLSKDEREKELKTELEKHGLELRSDSTIVEEYINNSKRAHSLSQSVELIRREHLVLQHVGNYYRKLLDKAYTKMKVDFFDEQEDWSEFWQEEKQTTEAKALKFFTKAKKNGTLTEIRKCECGEPLFVAEELEKLEKGTRTKKTQKK